MLIAILDFQVDPEQREHALTQLLASARQVRMMPGNVNFRAFGSPESGASITVVHEWHDLQSLDVYLASEVFARFGRVLRPMMTGAPSTRRYDATLLENVG